MNISWSYSLCVLAERFGDRPAVMDSLDQTLSFNQLNTFAHRVAAKLFKLGVLPGQAVASLLPNCIHAVWTSYGIRLHGAAETPLSWGYTLDEIQWCQTLSKFEYVLTTSSREAELHAIGLRTLSIEAILEEYAELTPHKHQREQIQTYPGVAAQETGRILFTSGTTGKPKGVTYTHGARWAGEQLLKATLPFLPEAGDKLLLMTPFVHGASLLTYAWCDLGGTVILHQGVDTDRVGTLLQRETLSAIFAPPTVLAKITTAFEGQSFSSVKCVFTGTQPLTAALYKKASKMFGHHVRITYGKSECINPITVLDRQATRDYFAEHSTRSGACVGWPAPGVEIKIVRPESYDTQASASENSGASVADATDGEIYLRAAHMSAGLIDQHGFRAHQPEGWHQTGDLGYFDAQGRLMLTGRVADVIKTGGYRVNPDEIEAALAHNNCGALICVTSIASDYWGEIIVAVAETASEGWQEHCQSLLSNMSRHKQPRHYLSVDSLPRNPQGKISRKQVSKMILQTYQLIDGPYPALVAIDSRPQ